MRRAGRGLLNDPQVSGRDDLVVARRHAGRLRALAALAVATALTVLVGAAVVVLVDRSAISAEGPRIEDRVRASMLAAGGVGTWFATARGQAEAIAKRLGPWTGTPAQIAASVGLLGDLVGAAESFDDGAVVMGRQYRVLAATPRQQALVGLVRDWPFVQDAADAGKTVVTPVFEDPLLHAQVVGVVTPLRDAQGRVSGILLTTTRVPDGSLSRSFRALRSDSVSLRGTTGVQLMLVDPAGAVITSESQSLQRDIADAREPAARARKADLPGFVEYRGEGGVAKVAGYARVVDDWVVVLAQDASEFYPGGGTLPERLRAPGPARTAALALGLILFLVLTAGTLLARRLSAARADAEESKRAFLAITGHELRTPLTAIRGFSQTLERRWATIEGAQAKGMIQTISRQARNLEHLVERLILASQLDAGISGAGQMRVVDLAGIIEQQVEHHRALTRLHTIELETARPLMVNGDAKALEQVLAHLLENAIKYSPSGGTIRVTGRRTHGSVEVVVEDEGVGLPSDISGIFDKFGQGEAVDTRVHDEGGVGVGLFIVRRHLELMGGRVRAERRDPAGARFVVTLRGTKEPAPSAG